MCWYYWRPDAAQNVIFWQPKHPWVGNIKIIEIGSENANWNQMAKDKRLRLRSRFIINIIFIIIIIMALQPFVGPWLLFQFLDRIHSW
jgi:hypothetical protein